MDTNYLYAICISMKLTAYIYKFVDITEEEKLIIKLLIILHILKKYFFTVFENAKIQILSCWDCAKKVDINYKSI